MGDGFLHKYFLNNGAKQIHKWIHYFDIYERHFERFRGKAPVMVEVGVFNGGSLQMWKSYFGPGSTIVGIDINPDCKQHESDGVEVMIGSQDDPNLIDELFQKHPSVDILLDDGSHVMRHMIATFELAYQRINNNGVYMVEDCHTCYWEKYGGGLKRAGSFMEYAKDRIDDINAVHSKEAVPVSDFTRSTTSISFYDSVVVFEKTPQGARSSRRTMAMGT